MMLKLWNVYRYEIRAGELIAASRTALMKPLPDKAGCEYLAREGNKLAAEEEADYVFRVERDN